MKKLIAVLMLVASSGLFGADVSELNVIELEREMLERDLGYVRIIGNNIAGKRSLLEHTRAIPVVPAHPAAPVDTTTPADDAKADASANPVEEDSVEDVPVADVGDDSSGSGVVETKGVLGEDIKAIYDKAGLTIYSAKAIEKEVEQEFEELSTIDRLFDNKDKIRSRKIKEAQKIAKAVARVSQLLAKQEIAPTIAPTKEQKDLAAILDFSVFRNLYEGFGKDISSSGELLKAFKDYRIGAFATFGTKAARSNVQTLFIVYIEPYINNILVVDLLYLNLITVLNENSGWFGAKYRAVKYEEMINTDLATKVNKLRLYFDAPDMDLANPEFTAEGPSSGDVD